LYQVGISLYLMMKMHGQTTLKEIACIIITDNPKLINSMKDFLYTKLFSRVVKNFLALGKPKVHWGSEEPTTGLSWASWSHFTVLRTILLSSSFIRHYLQNI